MTPAEYARSQGWMVGDLLAMRDNPTVAKVDTITDTALILTAPGCGILVLKARTWRRIGRVLRPSNEGR